MCCLGNHDHDARHKKMEVKEAEIHPEMITSTTSRKQNRRGDNATTLTFHVTYYTHRNKIKT